MDKVVILARVSTDRQEYRRQINELKSFCQKMNWDIAGTFANKVSGAESFENRTELRDMIEFVRSNDVKRIVCLEISRLGRNTLEALKVIQILNENKVSLYIKNYSLETLNGDGSVNPVASLICTILLEIASMERLTIRERMNSGRAQYIDKCRKEGIKMGRPSSYKKDLDSYRLQYQKEIGLLKKGISLRNISSLTGTSVNTIRKVKELCMPSEETSPSIVCWLAPQMLMTTMSPGPMV